MGRGRRATALALLGVCTMTGAGVRAAEPAASIPGVAVFTLLTAQRGVVVAELSSGSDTRYIGVNAADGRRLWSYAAPAGTRARPAGVPGSLLLIRPAAGTAASSLHLTRLDADGTTRWSRDLPGTAPCAAAVCAIASHPAYAGLLQRAAAGPAALVALETVVDTGGQSQFAQQALTVDMATGAAAVLGMARRSAGVSVTVMPIGDADGDHVDDVAFVKPPDYAAATRGSVEAVSGASGEALWRFDRLDGTALRTLTVTRSGPERQVVIATDVRGDVAYAGPSASIAYPKGFPHGHLSFLAGRDGRVVREADASGELLLADRGGGTSLASWIDSPQRSGRRLNFTVWQPGRSPRNGTITVPTWNALDIRDGGDLTGDHAPDLVVIIAGAANTRGRVISGRTLEQVSENLTGTPLHASLDCAGDDTVKIRSGRAPAVEAYDGRNFRLLWRRATPSVKLLAPSGTGCRTDVLIVTGASAQLTYLDGRTGRPRWKASLAK